MTNITLVGEKPSLAYTLTELAAAVGCSVDMVQRARKHGELKTSYVGKKPVFLVADAEQWVQSLPNTPPAHE